MTGEVSGLIVIDIDPRNGGDRTYDSLLEEYGVIPETIVVNTGGGGRHIYLKHEKGLNGGNNKLGAGVDVKSDKGYVVAPPSNHVLGLYEWREGCSPSVAKLATMPKEISELVFHEDCKVSLVGEKVVEGNRNNSLASFAGKLRAKGKSRKQIEIALLQENYNNCIPRLDSKEVLRIAKSICKYKIGKTTPVHIWRDYIRSEFAPSGRKGPSMRLILLNLSFYMDGNGMNCYPTQETLAIETGHTEAHISNQIDELEELGWILKVGHKGRGQKWRNLIYLPKLPKKLLLAEYELIKSCCPEALNVLSWE